MAYPKGKLPYIEGQPIISLSEARERGLSRYFTGVPCKRDGHVCEREVLSRRCIQCRRDTYNKWRKTERGHTRLKAARAANPEYYRSSTKRWAANNADKVRAYTEQYYSDLEHREQNRAHSRRRMREQPEYYRAKGANYRAQKRNATPWWADLDAIRAVYAEMVRLNQTTSIEHHVDHIVPLVSKKVCGLHVACNLRIVTAFENLSKRNRLIEDIEFEEGFKARQLRLFG